MMKRTGIAVLASALFLATAACSGPQGPVENDDGSPETSEAALTQTPAQRAARIVTILSERGALMPPPFARSEVNEMSATAELVPFTDSLRKMLEAQSADLVEEMGGNRAQGILSMSAESDTALSVQFSYGDQGVREYLLASLVGPAKKRSIAAHLTKLTSTYARMSVHNAAAEIIGHEVILIRPYELDDKVIVIRITYAHA